MASYPSNTSNQWTLIVDVNNVEVDIPNNRSKVSWAVKLKDVNRAIDALCTYYLAINGANVWASDSGGTTITDTTMNNTTELASGTTGWITHTSDGSKSVAISAGIKSNITTAVWSIPQLTINETLTLATIPRTSTFTIPASFNVGSAFTVNITRASSSFTHEVAILDGNTAFWWSGNNITTSGNINVPAGTLITRMSGLKSKTFTVRVGTFNGSTHIGTTSKTITANIPTSSFTIPSSFNVGSAFTVSISRVSSSLTHIVELWDGGTNPIYWKDGIGTSDSVNVSANTLISRISGASWKEFTVTVTTLNGSTFIGNTSKRITAGIPLSTFTAPTSFTMGSAFTVDISRVGSLTHQVSLHDGSTAIYWSDLTSSTSPSVNLALSTLASRSPNSMSKTFTLRVNTYNGGFNIGSTTKSITAYVPSSVKPTFEAVTVSENVSSVASLVGAYVQTKSQLKLAITGASGIYGSTIKSYNITGVGHNVNSSSTVTGYLTVSGNQTITGTVTDSRGQIFEKSIVVNILPYTPPVVSNLSFRRTLSDKTEAPLGDNVTVTANVKVQSLIVNGVEKNSIWYQVQSAQSGGSFADKANTTDSALTKSYSDVWSGYSVDYPYNFRVRIGDVFGFGGWSVGAVPTGIVTQQWGSATTSFGKMIDNTSYNLQVGTGGIHSDGPIVAEKGIKSPYGILTSANLPIIGDNTVKHFVATQSMTTGKPPKDGFITHYEWRNTGGWSSQLFIPNDDASIGFRRMISGVWSEWYNVWSSSNSQAMVDWGSNANGRYVKFSDGTQICWMEKQHQGVSVTQAHGSVFRGGVNHDAAYPGSFISKPSVSLSSDFYNIDMVWVNAIFPTAISYRPLKVTSSSSVDFGVLIIAIGRWK